MQVDDHIACHGGTIELSAPHNTDAPADTGALTAKFVHYPDSQQLQVWLPAPWVRSYTDWRRCDAGDYVAEQGRWPTCSAVRPRCCSTPWPGRQAPGAWQSGTPTDGATR